MATGSRRYLLALPMAALYPAIKQLNLLWTCILLLGWWWWSLLKGEKQVYTFFSYRNGERMSRLTKVEVSTVLALLSQIREFHLPVQPGAY